MSWNEPEIIMLGQPLLSSFLGALFGGGGYTAIIWSPRFAPLQQWRWGPAPAGWFPFSPLGQGRSHPNLGAGMILHDKARTGGLATAALLWATASVGLAIANSLYVIGIFRAFVAGVKSLHRKNYKIFRSVILDGTVSQRLFPREQPRGYSGYDNPECRQRECLSAGSSHQ